MDIYLPIAGQSVNALLMIFGPDSRHTDLPYSYDSWFVGAIIVDKVGYTQ